MTKRSPAKMGGKTGKLVAIVGETASGKSGLAHRAALELGGEIIAADSRTIYRGMDIGTAKPGEQERAEVRYHLLDVAEPGGRYTAADFKRDALAAIEDISSRGRLPILVGGTGLYVDAVLFDFSFGADRTGEREHLQEVPTEELARRAEALAGPLSGSLAANRRHLIRIIERGGQAEDARELRQNTLVVGLSPPRSALRRRIEERVEQMFRAGLRREVERLAAAYGWESEALTGIGYREFRAHYEGGASMSAVKRAIVQSTLHLAKRQRTWFKRNPHIVWFEDPRAAMARISSFAHGQ